MSRTAGELCHLSNFDMFFMRNLCILASFFVGIEQKVLLLEAFAFKVVGL
jgi:hypothetical protein